MNITICIPSVGRHAELQAQAEDVGCKVLIGQDLGNASETRRALAEQVTTDWILYLDDDILFEDRKWFDKLRVCAAKDTAVFARTIWRVDKDDPSMLPDTYAIDSQCILVESKYCQLWDKHLGTTKGLIGGDGESEVFMRELQKTGVRFARADVTAYHYGISTAAFNMTDRAYLGYIYTMLALHKDHEDFFEPIKRFPCDPKNSNNLADGYDLKECYRGVCDAANVII